MRYLLFTIYLLLISGLIFGQSAEIKLNIQGDTMVCRNFYYTYNINIPEAYEVEWMAKGGEIYGDNTLDSITVLWTNNGNKTIKVVVRQHNKHKISVDSTIVQIRNLRLISKIVGPKENVSDSRSEYKLELKNGVMPDYIHWRVTGKDIGCVIGKGDSLECNIQWYYQGFDSKTYVFCEIGKCALSYSQALPVVIRTSSTPSKITSSLIEIKGTFYYKFTAITKGNKASKYIWNFNDGTKDTIRESSVIHQFNNINDSIHTIYLQVIDSTNGLISPVLDRRFKINRKAIIFLSDTGSIGISKNISCAKTNNSYDVSLSTKYKGGLKWYINNSFYSTNNHIVINNNQPNSILKVMLTDDKSKHLDSINIRIPSLPQADFIFANVLMDRQNHAAICEGNSIEFVNKSTSEKLVYQWDFGDNTMSAHKNPAKAYEQSQYFMQQYPRLKVTNQYGCSSDTFKIIKVYNNTISQNGYRLFKPMQVEVYSDSIYSNANIEVIFAGGNAPFRYQWYRECELLPDQKEKTLKRVKSQNTYYFVKVTDRNGCYKYFHIPPARTKLVIGH